MTFVRAKPAQSTAARRHQPAARVALCFALFGVLASQQAFPAYAQHPAHIGRNDVPFVGEIGGPRLGQVVGGVPIQAGETSQNHTQITLDGWVFRSSLRPANRDGHTLAIFPTIENLRESPNGRILARMVQGFLLDEVERQARWVHVRRSVWVAATGLGAAEAAVPVTQDAGTSRSAANQEPPQPADPRRAIVRRRLQLFRAPDSTAIGSLEAGNPVRITARAGSWVRIEAQAWVRESEIRPSDTSILSGLSAAELRGAPNEYRGKLLRWTIQFLSLQTADELRPDFTPGQKYILARGPAPEYAFVYIIVPPARLAEVQRLEPLASVQVVARVVNGRSQYLANPILELVELQ